MRHTICRCGSTLVALGLLAVLLCLQARADTGRAIFNVRDYGAAGTKSEDAQAAIQKAIDACAKAGGGEVYLPPGQYTSGTLHVRSHVRLVIESGATLFASKGDATYDKPALIYGEDVEDISIEGHGTVDGEAEYVWRENDITDFFIRDNQLMMESLGKPLMRSFPKGLGQRKTYPHLAQLLRAKDVTIRDLKFLRSPSWTINPIHCERLNVDGIYIYTDQKMGVWADGIDPDGCKDVHISNSTIETGDDAIVFYSMNWYGPPRPCENITITNCRLSSASSAIKFCDGNMNAVRNVTVDNCVITDSNRGIAFMVYDGGTVEDVVISNLVVLCKRYDWFWWGNGDPIYFTIRRRSEVEGKPPQTGEPAAGIIRNVILRNIIAHGQGSCLISGHPDSWLENVSLENTQFFLSTDPSAAYDRSVHAFQFRYVRDLKLKDIEVTWDKPESPKWECALYLHHVKGLRLDGFTGGPAKPKRGLAAVVFDNVWDARVSNSTAPAGTDIFLKVKGKRAGNIALSGNDFHGVRSPYRVEPGVKSGAVRLEGH